MSVKKTSDGDKLLHCTFCGKNQHEVKKLIAGPSVFICDECIALCNDIIREEAGQPKQAINWQRPCQRPKKFVSSLTNM